VILDTIVAHKREEVRERKAERPLPRVPDCPDGEETGGAFIGALGGPGVSVIAELKKASPSRGVIAEDFDPPSIARAYRRGGAAALSCLTDERFFQGCADHLVAAREATGLPVLRKDFVIDEYQISESVAMGANAVLLIAAILPGQELAQMLAAATGSGLDVLVEVHDPDEARRALDAGAVMLGVNNRDLRDFSVDIRTTERVLGALADRPSVVVSESGIGGAEDMRYLRGLGVQAALIGESLMRAADPESAVRRLREAGAEQ